MAARRTLLLGATGLVGQHILELLLADDTVQNVRVIARRPTGQKHTKLEEHLFDLSEMDKHAELFAVDDVFCALGTTIRKAGSQERFRVVDHDYPINAAKLALAHGARQYLLVSALGANPRSRVFYNRVKGEVEQDLIALGYSGVTIARPSVLDGKRDELRLGEEIALRLGWLLPPRVKPIDARAVARALVDSARERAPGVHVLESRAMREMDARRRVG
jgi:uncharacterized protein YbjT (DUF2867 family)